MEIYSIGGGEIVYEVLKAVTLCLNGGSGLMTAMLRIGGFVGAFIAYYMILYGNPMQVFKSWGVPVLLIMNVLFLPTSSVYVIDTITKFHYKIDKVPYGLALFASQASKLGKSITEIVEQSFSTPNDMKYQKNGIVFGSDILEKSKTFRITNANFKENLRNFVGQCVKYDIMLNQKYSFDDLKNTNNLWALITSNPSKNRGIYWIPISEKGMSIYVSCEGAAAKFKLEWDKELDRSFSLLGRKFFAGRIGVKDSNAENLKMDARLEIALKNELKTNLFSITGYLGNMAGSTEETLKQALLINGIGEAASENSKLAGNAITYAETRALQQQSSTFDTIGRLAAKMLPIMKAVIESLVYACFIFIIPLCMVPSGYKFLINWLGALVWLQVWPPMFAILNYIMNIAARASTLSEIGTVGGLTIANYMGVSEANENIKLMAGYLSMSIPFICIAIVKGVGSFVHLASQMTSTSMSAAGSAAAEVSSGNFSFGNISMRNQQLDNLSQLQRSYSSSLSAGGHTLDTGGVQIRNDASGFSTYSHSISSGPTDYSATNSNTEELRAGISESEQRAHDASVKLSNAQSVSQSEVGRMAQSVSKMSAQDLHSKYNVGAEQAKNVIEAAKVLDSYSKGHTYTDQTQGGGNLSFGLSAGASLVGTKGGSNKATTEDGKNIKQVSASASIGANAGIGGSGGVQSTNATSFGDSKQGSTSEDYSQAQRTFESFMKDVSTSDRNDEVTQIAKDHQNTLQSIDTYAHDRAYSERMAKSYQESYNKANSLTFAERRNLTQEAYEIGQERGFGKMEAERIMNSSRDADKSLRDSWLMEAKGRNQVRMSPNKPSMRNTLDWNAAGSDGKGYNHGAAEESFGSAYEAKQDATQAAINKIDAEREDKKQNLHGKTTAVKGSINHKIKKTKSAVSQKEPQIKNNINKIRQKGEDRSEDGAAWSAMKHAGRTLNPSSKNDG